MFELYSPESSIPGPLPSEMGFFGVFARIPRRVNCLGIFEFYAGVLACFTGVKQNC